LQTSGQRKRKYKNGNLYLGFNNFKIDKEPTIDVNGTYMILDGHRYYNDDGGTCNDGIKNQNESDIDCGGICQPCPTCSDGIKNQDEVAIDCGGIHCDSCFSSFPYDMYNNLGGGRYNFDAKVLDVHYLNGVFKITVDIHPKLQLDFKADSVGTYDFLSSTYIDASGFENFFYYKYGPITITEFDKVHQKISGSFSFTGALGRATSFGQYCDAKGKFKKVKYVNQ
jgi:hypothetical protein